MNDMNKVQEEIIKSDIKKDEKLWKEVDSSKSLADLLDKMTKDELVKVSKKYSLKGLTSLKKADVIAKISDAIVQNNEEVISLATEEAIEFLEDIIKVDGVKDYDCHDIIYANFWRNRGIVFTSLSNGEPIVVIPDELKDSIKANINKDNIRNATKNGDIIKIIGGCAFYFGFVEYNVLRAMVERAMNEAISEEQFKALLLMGEELGYDYVIADDFNIAHIDVEDEEQICSLQKASELEYYNFDKKSLIQAGRQDYFELNKQGQKLTKVLGELFVIDKEILREEMEGLQVAIKNEMEITEAVDNFLEAYQIESDEERKILSEELEIYVKSIRKWALKGHTEDEREKDSNRVVNTVRIGRNDPCICGSGKKYKKCCG